MILSKAKVYILKTIFALLVLITVNFLYTFITTNQNIKFSEKNSCYQKGIILKSCNGYWQRMRGSQTLYNVSFATDQNGFRTFNAESKIEHDTSLTIFFGGSELLGAGVNNNETLPYYFYQLSQTQKVANWGIRGGGAQHLLYKLQNQELNTEDYPSFKQKYFVYYFSASQILHAVGSWNSVSKFAMHYPYYALNEANIPVYLGTFASAKRYPDFLYTINTPLVNDLLSAFSNYRSFNDDSIRLTVKILAESKKIMLQENKTNRFVVLLSGFLSETLLNKVKLQLKAENIEFLDYSKLVDLKLVDNIISDGHPSPIVNETYAKQLVKDLY